jgi:hypothetical protein
MAKYIVGQTYEALILREFHNFIVLEEGSGQWEGAFAIRWDDGSEEWAYSEELNRWAEAAKEKEEEEKYK